jgi:hypothetical protein
MTNMPARMPEGLRAKAPVVWAFYQPEPPTDSVVDDILWQRVCQVAGKPECAA